MNSSERREKLTMAMGIAQDLRAHSLKQQISLEGVSLTSIAVRFTGWRGKGLNAAKRLDGMLGACRAEFR